MATYTLAVKGIRSDAHEAPVQNVLIPDSMVPSAGVNLTTATLGGQMAAMRANTPMLCKNPDGSFSWYTLDAERSTPAVPVLRAV